MGEKLMSLVLLLLLISLLRRDATSTSFSAGFLSPRRAAGEWSSTPSSQKEGFISVAPYQDALSGDKSTDRETENTSNMEEAEDIVYNIDYHGVTTHPTPTPRHPTAP